VNADQVLAEACEQAGLDDLGDGGEVALAGLAAYVEACDAEADLSELGGMVVHGALVAALVNRLRVTDHVARHPEVRERPIEAPVVVVGLFRAGTTLISNLLDQDPANRALLRWESGDSVPPPAPHELRAGPRVDAGQAGVDMLEAINPGIRAIHHEDADAPTECIAVLGQAFQSISWEALANVPSYAEWWRSSDLTAGYAYHRDVLQVLQSNGCDGRWTLKSPGHALALDALTAVYPDARLVVLHRDPVALTASVSSLIHTMSSAFSDVDHRSYIREHWTRTLEDCIGRIDAFDAAHPGRLHHVQYADLVTDPVGTVRRLYEHLGLDATDEALGAIASHVRERPRGAFGVHSYDLASYGLVEGDLRERFSGYVDRYAVPHEAPATEVG
jgi:hypothetical protein